MLSWRLARLENNAYIRYTITGQQSKNLVKDYFELQYNITNRSFKDAGFKPFLAYIILILIFYGGSIYLFGKTIFAEAFYVFFALVLMGRFSEVKRNEFLVVNFGNKKKRQVRIVENIIVSFPFLVFLLYKQLVFSGVVLLVLAMVLAMVNFRTSFNFTIWTPFSKRPFEFTTGFRKTFYLIFVAYILTLIAVSVNNFNLGVFAIFLIFITTLTYYLTPENEYYVWVHKDRPKQFLYGKIKIAVLFSSAFLLPPALLLATLFIQQLWALLLVIFMGLISLVFMILSKYSAYPKELSIPQGVILVLCLWFPPSLIIVIPYLFKKSVNRLENFL